jgi:hypothetical protein
MKKLIGIVAALAVFFAQQACSEGDDPAPGIRLSTETLDFPAGKSTLDLVVSSPQQWRLRVSAEWCYVLGADVLNEPCEGKTFRVGVDGNNALKGREALITLTRDGENRYGDAGGRGRTLARHQVVPVPDGGECGEIAAGCGAGGR